MNAEKLISEMFVRLSLWHERDKNYCNKFILDKLWNKVALKLNTRK